ncbi:kinesin-like protein KIN-14F [Andrographis paniculata]|uniref:kinesin-like protein KIN-14F n=1 Tax=Andrographis paniculata TaxID=175694 RepID=UPI0021E72358|nr:kinesin-like protein KIN-14F [Andrographis paniculata]
MPLESYSSIFNSPSKNLRGLKSLIYNNGNAPGAEEIINDHELAQRKAEESASRRYQAAQWLRQMDQGASEVLPREPTEEEFCLALRNGLILCNVLNKVNPGAVHKVVENPVVDVQAAEGAAQSAIQYFENMRNFLVAVGKMKLLTFEASDLEKGGSSGKVVECILCLKGYYEWKQSGGIGVWRYGGTVRITSFMKESPSSALSLESADESIDGSDSSQYDQLMEFLQLSTDSHEDSKAINVLTFMFDHFSLGLLQSCLSETNELDDFPLSPMVIDVVLRKALNDFSAALVSQGNQLSMLLKKLLSNDSAPHVKLEFLEAISKYLNKRAGLVSRDISYFCFCGGKGDETRHQSSFQGGMELLDRQQKQLEDLKALFRETKQEVRRATLGWENEFQCLGNNVKGLEVAASSYHKVLEENRLLYNQVQDLKGTIRVYCRVRPFLSEQCNEQSTVDYIGENGNIMIVNPLKQGKEARRVFSFNKVFGTNVTQQHIYADTQPLVRSVLDGYNVCIFAYGQTGSGKTYTMSGPDLNTEETWGVNYRALRDLFHISEARMDTTQYEIGVQMIEIYNEQVRDLLVSDGSNRRLDIRNNSQLNGLNVPDASLIPVICTQDVLELMRIGHRNRAVGATALNVRSSRSHSILTIHVRGKELVSGSLLKGCLHLVDLAGSERVDKSEAVGERLKEAQHINRSLSALGDVIAALAQKSSHVPYRNSKLTQVLQDSLGGHAKTLMFVHINPEVNALGETISTLKFAERVATIDLGAAKSNKEVSEVREFKEEISNLKLALERKEAELELMKSRTNIRAISPLRVSKFNGNGNVNPSSSSTTSQLHDTQITEVRSCSSGKQRRSRLPSKFVDKDVGTKVPLLAGERSVSSIKQRSPSPPIRRSISTDRGAGIRPRIRPDTVENPPTIKVSFPSGLSVIRSVPNVPSIILPSVNTRLNQGSQEPPPPDALNGVQRVTLRRVNSEHEDQLRQALNNRQGGTRKAKPDNKVKIKQQPSSKAQKSSAPESLHPDVGAVKMHAVTQRIDSSEPENDQGPFGPPACGPTRSKKLHRTYSRNSQNVEPREAIQTEDHPSSGPENKLSSGREAGYQYPSVPGFGRSRSTPRGKFIT